MKKTLVTGGAGFIGSHIVDALVVEGHEVRVLDNLATGGVENVRYSPRVEFVQGDIRDLEQLTQVARGADVIFHQAALPSVPRSIADPRTCHEVNATGTFNVLLAARDAYDDREWTDSVLDAERAQADGDLAAARSRQHRAEAATAEIERSVEALRTEMGELR